jgi:hypothetical protein
MNREKRRKAEKLQDKLEPEKALVRNLSRAIDRLDENNQLQRGLLEAFNSRSAVRVENLKEIEIPSSFEIKNLKDIPKPPEVKIPDVQAVRMAERPEWYKDPIAPPDFKFPKEIAVNNLPKLQKVEMDRPRWWKEIELPKFEFPSKVKIDWENAPREEKKDAPPLWLPAIFAQLFAGLGKLLKNIIPVRLERGEIDKPQFFIQLDPKTGRPIGAPIINVEQRIPPTGTGSGSGIDPVGLKNISNAKVNPATEDTLAAIKVQTDKLTFDPLNFLKINQAAGGVSSIDVVDRAARLLGIIYGNLGQIQQKSGTLEQLTWDDNLAAVFGTTPLVNAARLKTMSSDGDDASIGATTDAETAGNGSLIAIAKRLRTILNGGLPATLVNGRLDVNLGGSTEPATFTAIADRVAPAANKFILTLFNTSSTRKIVIQKVLIYNWQTAVITGVLLEFEVKRITARTAGVAVTPFAHDSNDALSAGISADTGSTAVTEGTLIRRAFSASEETKIGALTLENSASVDDNFAMVVEKKDGTKGHVLRQNQGIAIKQITSSTVGNVSAVVVFTDEPA